MAIELIVVILGIVVAMVIGAWQIYLAWKQNRMTMQTSLTKDEKLVDSFALGYSLIGAVAAVDNPSLSSQRSTCLHGLQLASEKLDLNTSTIVKQAVSLDRFLADSESIPSLRAEIRKRYGTRASEAFEMAIWLAVSPLADDQGRRSALTHAEEFAQKIGFDKEYTSRFFRRGRKISDRFQFADEVARFITETLKQLENMQRIMGTP
ncbi:MAG: hypothetical protein NTZ17_02310 [Phycisphaerae bacterium]|nr:hypothetical protein [Phycisphaerae bacterium]